MAATIDPTEADVHMCDVSKESIEVCQAIQALLAKCKPAVPQSARSTFIARARMTLKKSDIEGFQERLRECSRSLNSIIVTKTL
jgi:hypothetical protein